MLDLEQAIDWCHAGVVRAIATIVNDVHAGLNETACELLSVDSLDAIRGAVRQAGIDRRSIAVAGGRHAMGGQQFCQNGLVLDTTAMSKVLGLDEQNGIVEVEAGIQWPALIGELNRRQEGLAKQWAIVQKQTGADRLSIGGALAANAHGRGLAFRPFIGDVESFVLVNAAGEAMTCSREQNAELFGLVIGGYGLFGCVYSVRLRLRPRQLLERVVEMRDIATLFPAFDERIRAGFVYGDCQFVIDPASPDFLRKGVFSCYRPVERAAPPPGQRVLSHDDWQKLMYLAHTDKARAVQAYVTHYLATSGQLYYSDAHQLADYTDGYHLALDKLVGAIVPASEMITEIYVPRDRLADFLAVVADDFRTRNVDLIYGTIRLIERDDESFLAWARDRWACVIFNIHTVHDPAGIAKSIATFRRLIDRAIERDGSYYLTYHKWATRQQLDACYPQFAEFLRAKRRYDPEERFQSDWYRHNRAMYEG